MAWGSSPQTLGLNYRVVFLMCCVFIIFYHLLDVSCCWLRVEIRDPDWRVRLKNFDAVFFPGAADDAQPMATAQDAEKDLADPNASKAPVPGPDAAPSVLQPPSMTEEEFKQKFPTAEAITTVTLNHGGSNIVCYLVDGKVFLMSNSKTTVLGANSNGSKPLLMYSGGTWISEDAKVSVGYFLFVCLCCLSIIRFPVFVLFKRPALAGQRLLV